MRGSITTDIGGRIYVDGDEIEHRPSYIKVGMVHEDAHIELHMPARTLHDLVGLLKLAEEQVAYRNQQRRLAR